MTTDEPAVRVRDLRKSYGSIEAVRGIDLDVRRGEIVALLGPNGAGKTTTVEILEGYRQRTSGDVSVLGRDPAHGEPALKERIGIVLQTSAGERYLTAHEIVAMYAGYYPHARPADELLELVGLAPQAKTRVKKLSGGQRRRLDLAIALAGDPELLFLDEPTTGFDPSARRGAWSMVRELVRLGKTVLLTTHFMDEAQALADRIAVLVDGRIVAEGTPGEVIARQSSETIVRLRLPPGAPMPPSALGLAATADGALAVRTTDPTTLLHEVTGWALQESVAIADIEVARPSLEDVYIALTGRSQDEDDGAGPW
jgi:ABC-2 type transport system ATP-binding protein